MSFDYKLKDFITYCGKNLILSGKILPASSLTYYDYLWLNFCWHCLWLPDEIVTLFRRFHVFVLRNIHFDLWHCCAVWIQNQYYGVN